MFPAPYDHRSVHDDASTRLRLWYNDHMKSEQEVTKNVAEPDVTKVGPKGYIHGWIKVGAGTDDATSIGKASTKLRSMSDKMHSEAEDNDYHGGDITRYHQAGVAFSKAADALDAGKHDEAVNHLNRAIGHGVRSRSTTTAGDNTIDRAKKMYSGVTGKAYKPTPEISREQASWKSHDEMSYDEKHGAEDGYQDLEHGDKSYEPMPYGNELDENFDEDDDSSSQYGDDDEDDEDDE